MKKFVFSILIVCLFAFTANADYTMLDRFEDTDYIVSEDVTDPTTESLIITNSSDSTDGGKSLEVTYSYIAEAIWEKNASIEKEFDELVDMSDMEGFKFDFKLAQGDPTLLITMYFIDELGYKARFEDYTIFSATPDEWVTRTYKLSDLHKNQWDVKGRPINMKKIASYKLYIMSQAANPAGTISFKLDNMFFLSGLDLANETVLEDFESYADDTALQAVWSEAFTRTSNPTLNTTNPSAGSKCISFLADLSTGHWVNYGGTYTFPSPVDLSSVAYFKVSVYGDSILDGLTPTTHLYLVDSDGNRAISYAYEWGKKEEWCEIFLPLQLQGIDYFDSAWVYHYSQNSCWLEERWDDGVNWQNTTDLSNITGIILAFETQVGTDPVNGVNILFDDVIVGFATDDIPDFVPPTITPIPTETPSSSISVWEIYR